MFDAEQGPQIKQQTCGLVRPIMSGMILVCGGLGYSHGYHPSSMNATSAYWMWMELWRRILIVPTTDHLRGIELSCGHKSTTRRNGARRVHEEEDTKDSNNGFHGALRADVSLFTIHVLHFQLDLYGSVALILIRINSHSSNFHHFLFSIIGCRCILALFYFLNHYQAMLQLPHVQHLVCLSSSGHHCPKYS